MSKEKRNYINDINELKKSVINNINTIAEQLIIPKELEYIELPSEVSINSRNSVFAIKKNYAVVNSSFEHSESNLIELTVEQLVLILEQVEIYKNENY